MTGSDRSRQAEPGVTSDGAAASEKAEVQVVRLGPGHMLLPYISGSFGFGFHALVGFIVPLRALELGAPHQVIGLIIGAGGLLPIFLSIPAGELVDRIGARRVYVVGTALSALVTAAYALTSSYWVMLVLELLVGFPRTMPWVASQAYITGIGTPEERATIMGRFSFTTNLVQMAGPLMAGLMAQMVGYQSSFWIAMAVAVGYTLIGLTLPDVRGPAVEARSGSGATGGFGAALGLLRL